MLLLGHRYYLPRLGRFLTQDPIGQAGGLNLYAYCENNPLNKVDPDGTHTADAQLKQAYPKSYARIQSSMARLTAAKVAAYGRIANAQPSAVRQAFKAGSGPIVSSRRLGYYGETDPNYSPARIFIAKQMLSAYEKGYVDGKFLDIILEHETAHYLATFDPKARAQDYSGQREIGEEYEKIIYKGVQREKKYLTPLGRNAVKMNRGGNGN